MTDSNLPAVQEYTKAQRIAKARFWEKVGSSPLIDASNVPAIKAAHLAGNNQVTEWLRDPEFAAWFFNRNSAKQMLEAGAEIAVGALVKILQEKNVGPREAVTAATQVNAAKVLLEYAGYAPARMKEVVYKDKEIGDMDEGELRAYIEREGRRLIDVTARDNTDD